MQSRQNSKAGWMLAALVLGASVLGLSCGDKGKKRRVAESQVALCLEHYDDKNYPQALAECLKAKEADPDYPEIYNMIGLIYHAQKRYPEAIENYREALELDSELSNARTNLGIALASIGRTDEAIEQFKQALKNDLYRSPDVALVNLCEAYLRKKEITTAIDHCKQALERNRSSCFAHYKLGEAYGELGQTRSLIEEMELAIKYCPNWDEPLLQRAEARIRLKQMPQACSDLWEVYGMDPESESARKAKRYAERIKCPAYKPKPKAGDPPPPSKKNPRHEAQPLPYAR